MSSINKSRGRKPMRKAQRILALLDKGYSPATIAKALKTSVSYVYVVKSKAAGDAPVPVYVEVPTPTAPVAAPVVTPVTPVVAPVPKTWWERFRDWIGV
jgi:hypothetical protein